MTEARPPLRLRRFGETGGAALIDIIVATSLCVLMAAIAVPVIGGTLDRERTIVGAQYLAGQLQRARLESLKRARSVAVRLEVVGDRTQLRLFADGNGNGVLQRDIDRGIDPPLTPVGVARRSGARHLLAHQPGRDRRRRRRRRSRPATIRCASATRRF